MATVRPGNQPVLLVVDVPVVWVQHTNEELPSGSAAWQWVQELNIAMTWLSYPGRHNGIATAEAVDFNSPGGAR
jgi:hypothetical protein